MHLQLTPDQLRQGDAHNGRIVQYVRTVRSSGRKVVYYLDGSAPYGADDKLTVLRP